MAVVVPSPAPPPASEQAVAAVQAWVHVAQRPVLGAPLASETWAASPVSMDPMALQVSNPGACNSGACHAAVTWAAELVVPRASVEAGAQHGLAQRALGLG